MRVWLEVLRGGVGTFFVLFFSWGRRSGLDKGLFVRFEILFSEVDILFCS